MTVRRAELAARAAARGTEYWLLLSEADAVDLASGFVPQAVKATVLGLLDGRAEATRRAGRPVPRLKGSRQAVAVNPLVESK